MASESPPSRRAPQRGSSHLLLVLLLLGGLGLAAACRAQSAAPDESADSEQPAGSLEDSEQAAGPSEEPAAASQPDGAAAGCSLSSGLTETQIEVDGRSRNYRLFVPEASGQRPLVFDFHGAGSSGEQQARVSLFESLAAAEGFLVVTPDGINGRWSERDVPLVETVLAELSATGCVDENRVHSAGMSNGGFFSTRLACDLSDRIASIATVTGMSRPRDCDPGRDVPIVHFHGTADRIVRFNATMREVDEWVEAFGCESSEELAAVQQITDAVQLQRFRGCDEAVIDLYVVADGGHTWPGSLELEQFSRLLGETNFDIDATAIAWEFFEMHPLKS